MLELIIRYAHFLGIMFLMSALVAEHLLISPEVSRKTLRRLAAVDAIYGASAVLVLATGLIQWLWVGKPAAFYTENWVFHAKLSLFILVALVSIYPTVFFVRNRNRDADPVSIPKSIFMVIRLELLLVALIPLLAVFVARGHGTP